MTIQILKNFAVRIVTNGTVRVLLLITIVFQGTVIDLAARRTGAHLLPITLKLREKGLVGFHYKKMFKEHFHSKKPEEMDFRRKIGRICPKKLFSQFRTLGALFISGIIQT